MTTHIALDEDAGPEDEDHILFLDNLLVGPSRRQLEGHVASRVRHAVEAGEESLDEHYSSVVAVLEEPALHVWLCSSWKSQLSLAFLCAHRPHQLEIHLLHHPTHELHETARCGVAGPRVQPVGPPRILSASERNQLKSLWSGFTSTEPGEVLASLDTVCIPEAHRLRGLVEDLFPRVVSQRTKLSALDHGLLSAARSGVSPWDFLPAKAADLQAPRRWALCGGDGFLAHRMRAWTGAPIGSPALTLTAEPSAERPRYALAEGCVSLLEDLPSLRDAPKLAVGGTEAYEPTRAFLIMSNG